MLSKSLKLAICNPTVTYNAPTIYRGFSLINEFLKKGPQAKQPSFHQEEQQQEGDDIQSMIREQKERQKKQIATQTEDDGQEYEDGYDPDDALAIHQQKTALQKELDLELDLPYKLYGNYARISQNASYMGDRIFHEHRIPQHFITSHLYKIYAGTLHSIARRDEEFINEYLEEQFAQKLLGSLDHLQERGYTVHCNENLTGEKGVPITPEVDFKSMLLVKGLDMDRSKNLKEEEYHVWKDIDDMGLVIYTPKYLQNPDNFKDPEINKTIYQDFGKMVFRAVCEIKSPLELTLVRPNGDIIQVDEKYRSLKHAIVFESEMKPAEFLKSSYRLQNMMEWLAKFKFGRWRMADMDNWMLSNPLILNSTTATRYNDPVFRGSDLDPEELIDLKRI